MNILYTPFKAGSKTARKYIEDGIIAGFTKNGHRVDIWNGTDADQLEHILEEKRPDVFYGYVRNQPNYGNASWITNDCFDVLNTYRKDYGMKVILESHPDIKPLFYDADIPMSLIEKNQAFYNQPNHGTPPEQKLVDEKFVDIITHIWNDFTTDFGFTWWRHKDVKVQSFPLAFDTGAYLKRDLPKEIDISFVGGWWPFKGEQLDKFVKPLDAEFGEKFQVFGTGWPYKSNGYIDDGAVNRVFNMSKINICIHEPTLVQPQALHVSERIFKVAGLGGMIISDNNACIKEYFTEDEVVIVRHPEQMVEACKYYLEHDEEREAMGKRAMDKVLDIHTYKRRTRELLNLL